MGAQEGQRVVVAGTVDLLHAVEKRRHGARVKAGAGECLHADTVGLALEIPAVRQLFLHRHARADLCGGQCRIGAAAGAGHQDRSQDAADGQQLVHALLLQLAGNVTLADVGHFVADDAGELRFALGRQQQAGMHADIAAGHGKGVDLAVVDGKQGVVLGRVRAGGGQPAGQPVEVVVQLGVTQHGLLGPQPDHALAAGA